MYETCLAQKHFSQSARENEDRKFTTFLEEEIFKAELNRAKISEIYILSLKIIC